MMKKSPQSPNRDQLPNVFTYLNNIRKKINIKDNQLKRLQSELNKLEKKHFRIVGEDTQRIEQLNDEINKLSSEEKSLKEKFNKTLRPLAISTVAVVSLITLPVGIHQVHEKSQEKFDENISSGYSMVGDNEYHFRSDNSDELNKDYATFKDNLNQYLELLSLDSPSSLQKKQMDSLRDLINANPQYITTFALESFKAKIAERFGIDDLNKVTVRDNSTDVDPATSRFNYFTGHITDKSISIAEVGRMSKKVNTYFDDGRSEIYENTLPEELEKIMDLITNAQRNPDNIRLAKKALNKVINIDMAEIEFPEFDNSISNKSIQNSDERILG